MLNFLYHIPGIYMALIIVGATVFCVFFGYAIVKYFHWLEVDAEQRALALTMVSIVTTINSLLVAFAAISVWGNYNDADRTVASEAISASELARDLSVFGSRDADAADLDLRTYLVRVVEAEWPSMQRHQRADPGTEICFTKVFKSVSLLSPATPRQTVLLSEVLARMNEMVKFRQQRLQGLVVCMPLTLWAVILIVSAMSFVLLYVLPPRPFYICLIGCWACTLGLAFFFIVAVDHPFAGDFSVSSSALQEAIENLTQSQVWPAP